MSQRVDKEAMACNKPRRTPGHPDKSHVVKACYDGKEKIIRFGEQGASTAGKPKAGESERMTKKRASFKARHAKNIAKGPSSAAYWANRVKWAQGGAVELRGMLDKYSEGGSVKNEYSDLIATLTGGAKPSAPVTQDSPTIRSLKQARPQRRRTVEPTAGDYARSVGSSVTSLPGAPKASFEFGQRLGTALPGMIGAGIDYFRRSSPGDVASDVGSALKNVAGYVADNPVSTVADFIPFVGEAKQYAETIQDAARRRALGDLAGAYNLEVGAIPLAAASLIPGIGEARGVVKAGTRTMKRPASFPVDYGRPLGNINLRPNIDPVKIKDSGEQRVADIIAGIKGNQTGVTTEGLEQLAKSYNLDDMMTAAQFGERMPGSKYSKVDLGSSVDNTDVFDSAVDVIAEDPTPVWENLADQLGLEPEDGFDLRLIYDGGVDSANPEVVEYLKRLQPDADPETLIGDYYQDAFHNAVSDYVDRMGDYGGYSRYKNWEHQRLVSDTGEPGYFEIGVTHPDVGDLDFESSDYRGGHYPGVENLAGHVRGTLNPGDMVNGFEGSPGNEIPVYGFTPKPNSMVIEELQSDLAKEFGNQGALHQIHGTLFKGAIQHALEGGVDTVYLPTAKTVASVRGMNPKQFERIYNGEVIKYGLNPLKQVPGVTVTPIDDMYHEITISPEARERILKGAGQKAPGYAEGGLVSSYDEAKTADLADQIREGIYG